MSDPQNQQISLAHTYAITGHIEGLLEAWLDMPDPPVAELVDMGAWDRLSTVQQDRILDLFNQIPAEHVLAAIQRAKDEEIMTGIPMFEHGGHYWPVFFYQMMLEDIHGPTAQIVLPQVRNHARKYVVLGQHVYG